MARWTTTASVALDVPIAAAAAMGTSKATLAVVVHRATRALRRALAEEDRS